jgi:hypothetical protein
MVRGRSRVAVKAVVSGWRSTLLRGSDVVYNVEARDKYLYIGSEHRHVNNGNVVIRVHTMKGGKSSSIQEVKYKSCRYIHYYIRAANGVTIRCYG